MCQRDTVLFPRTAAAAAAAMTAADGLVPAGCEETLTGSEGAGYHKESFEAGRSD
jgi:hypothetical protein